ncbi:sensor histidine kinase [Brevibacillus fluminis]|uniref:sensor histidine kinase n=1 Tax=Brevibacillus fluminis TaxID=511487 RepID=UPI003F8AB1BE
MFEQTRRKLTLFYGGIAALLLLVMVFFFYFSLSFVITANVKDSLQFLTAKIGHESREHHMFDWEPDKPPPLPDKGKGRKGRVDWDFLQPTQFAFVQGPEGGPPITSLGESQVQLTQTVSDFISQQPLEPGEMDHIQLTVDGTTKTYAIFRAPIDGLDPSDPIVYFGEDITSMDQLLGQMQLLLTITSVLLLGLGTAAGYFFAGRAMVPITQAYKRQKEFTADASHELRTPLSVMLSSTEILAEKKESLPPFHQTVLTGMMDEITRMIRMVENLLSLARSETDAAELPHDAQEQFDVGQMAREVCTQMYGSAAQKGVQLTLADEEKLGPLPFHGNKDQIRQLLYILIDNAIKYTDSGGFVAVSVASVKYKKLKITVKDTGCGIPEEDLPFIFERFYRIDKGRSRATGGTGLGLSIAAQIVAKHKGKISVESKLQAGTTFTVLLKDH